MRKPSQSIVSATIVNPTDSPVGENSRPTGASVAIVTSR
jgi:hypothetical protein